MDSTIKNKVVNGAFWSMFERFGYLSIQFVTNIILARLLTPTEFGTVGILLIFTSLSLVLVDGGLSSALIQRKNITDVDKNTVFFTNLSAAIFIYVLLWISAPYISTYFETEFLSLYLRWIGIIVIIDAMSSIQFTLLNREVNFKKIAWIKIAAATISTIISITSALFGAGVWALIVQYISYSIARCLLLWIRSPYFPKKEYSYEAFKSLFSFGSKLLLSNFIADVYIQFQAVIIGKMFNKADLGYFTQAKQLQNIPVGSISTSINAVSFPVYSSLQDDIKKLVNLVKKNLCGAVFINFPLMTFLTIEAKDIIVFFYSEKWVPAVPFFQYLCAGFGLLSIVHQTNLCVLKALGKSHIVLYLEIVKKILGISLIFVFTKLWGVMGVMYALTLNSVIEFFMNGYYAGKFTGFGIVKQASDILPTLFISAVVAIAVYWLMGLIGIKGWHLFNIVVSGLCYVILYIGLSYIFRIPALTTYRNIFKSRVKTIRPKTEQKMID